MICWGRRPDSLQAMGQGQSLPVSDPPVRTGCTFRGSTWVDVRHGKIRRPELKSTGRLMHTNGEPDNRGESGFANPPAGRRMVDRKLSRQTLLLADTFRPRQPPGTKLLPCLATTATSRAARMTHTSVMRRTLRVTRRPPWVAATRLCNLQPDKAGRTVRDSLATGLGLRYLTHSTDKALQVLILHTCGANRMIGRCAPLL